MILAFRRPKSDQASKRFKLDGLDAKTQYTVEFVDSSERKETAGGELMTAGLEVSIPEAAGSSLIIYRAED